MQSPPWIPKAWLSGVSSVRPIGCPHGLRKLSPDLISKARDETAAQVNRLGLTFVGTSAFCLLSLFSPDAALLGGNEKINVPLAGPVSFFGFMLLGPAVLIVLRVYLQIYVELSARLDRLARSMSVPRAPTLVPLRNQLLQIFSIFIFYVLLPITLTLFAWKAAVFPTWGSVLFGVVIAAIASHIMLPFSKYSWPFRGVLSVSVAIIAGAVIFYFELIHRPFDLYRANLSGQWLAGEDLRKADLRNANLKGADLSFTKLRGAELSQANLSKAILHFADLDNADLSFADLTGASIFLASLEGAKLDSTKLSGANLEGSDLKGANLLTAILSKASLKNADLTGASLYGADLTSADLTGSILIGTDLTVPDFGTYPQRIITQTQLDEACGDTNTKLPEGLKVKPCSEDLDWQMRKRLTKEKD